MTTDYQKRLMELGNVQFENIEDSDVLTFEQWEQGFGPRCFFYLYTAKGELKDIQCGRDVPLSERKMLRPTRARAVPVVKEKKEKKVKEVKVALKQPNVALGALKATSKKRNLSPEERERRANRMRQYWIARKAKSNASL